MPRPAARPCRLSQRLTKANCPGQLRPPARQTSPRRLSDFAGEEPNPEEGIVRRFRGELARGSPPIHASAMAPTAPKLDPVVLSLINAPVDDEPTTAEDQEAIERVDAAIRRGEPALSSADFQRLVLSRTAAEK
jgi:hypothetical protein